MLIEGAGVVAHRPTSVPFFISYRYEKVFPDNTIGTPFYGMPCSWN